MVTLPIQKQRSRGMNNISNNLPLIDLGGGLACVCT